MELCFRTNVVIGSILPSGHRRTQIVVARPCLTNILCFLFVSLAIATPLAKHSQAEETGPLTGLPKDDVSLTSLRYLTSEMLRLQATIDEGPQQDQATLALCDLYVRLRIDSRHDSSDMLQQDTSKIRRRLLTVAKQKRAVLKRNKVEPPNHLARDVELALAWKVDQVSEDSRSAGEPRTISPSAESGRPSGAFAVGGAFDNGWQLIELIQRVVEPDFWQSRGGPGTIQYFALRRVLVVSATTDVHEQIRDLLRMLSW